MDASTETPPRDERGRCSCCGVVAVLLLLVLAAAGVGGKWLFDRYNGGLAPVGAGAAQVFEVRSGDSLEQVAGRLEAAGLIRDAEVLRWRAEMREQAGALKAGWYELAPSLSVDEILDVLVEGRVATRRVTFPEGFTLEQMAQRAEAAGFGTAAEYRRLATDEAASFGVAGRPQGASLEGYLFPSTYELPISAAERELIEAQVAQFVKTWQAVAPADPPRPRHELVTIASMIERETQVDDERPRVSGVIANRLKRDMKLQIDATVQYARGEHKARLLYRDLEEDSPYNTYRHAGLPPGPIASPGRASLAAALAPESHDYLYYVLAPDNSGRHVFSATSAQHERAVQRYRQWRRSRS